MFRSYRSIIIAIGLVLFLCGAKPPKEHEQGNPSTNSAEQAAVKPYTPYPGYNPDPCYQAKDHDTADLCAQWRAAMAAEKAANEARRATNWSIVATFLSALGLGAIVWSLTQTERALVSSQGANEIAEKSLILTQRASIKVKPRVQRVIDKDVNKVVGLIINNEISNFGNTEAISVYASFGGTVSGIMPTEFPITEENCISNGVVYAGAEPAFFGAIEIGKVSWVDIINGRASAYIWGVVEYKDLFSEDKHCVEFCYRVRISGIPTDPEACHIDNERVGPHNRVFDVKADKT